MRNSWDTDPISASRNCSVSARMRASAMRAGQPEPLERGRGVVDDRDHPQAQIVESVGPAAEIDRDDAEIRGVDRDRTHQPGAAAAVVRRRFPWRPPRPPPGPAPPNSVTALGMSTLPSCSDFASSVPRGIEQQHLAADQRLQMALHGLEYAGGRIRRRQPLRERIEVADFVLALEREVSVAPGPRREIGRDQRHDEERTGCRESASDPGQL